MADAEWFLTTERLLVRGFTLDDLDEFHAYRNDPAVARWQGWDVPYSRESAEALVYEMAISELFRPGEWTQLALERKDTVRLIGDIGVRREPVEPTAEVGITLAADAQGIGYATEALDAVVEDLFRTLALARVIAIVHQENASVRRLLDRTGFAVVAQDGDELIFSRRAAH
ncbi:MAG: GNAT family N-acetyltransferase [Acidimicrobiia bacterium]